MKVIAKIDKDSKLTVIGELVESSTKTLFTENGNIEVDELIEYDGVLNFKDNKVNVYEFIEE